MIHFKSSVSCSTQLISFLFINFLPLIFFLFFVPTYATLNMMKTNRGGLNLIMFSKDFKFLNSNGYSLISSTFIFILHYKIP